MAENQSLAIRPYRDDDLAAVYDICVRTAAAGELRRFLAHEPVRARPVPGWERAVRWAKRRPTAPDAPCFSAP